MVVGSTAGGSDAPRLGVVVLDPTAVVGAAAPDAALATPAAAAVALLAAADAEAEEDAGEEEAGPGGPHEAEGVGADVGAAAGVLEPVPGFDECCAGRNMSVNSGSWRTQKGLGEGVGELTS